MVTVALFVPFGMLISRRAEIPVPITFIDKYSVPPLVSPHLIRRNLSIYRHTSQSVWACSRNIESHLHHCIFSVYRHKVGIRCDVSRLPILEHHLVCFKGKLLCIDSFHCFCMLDTVYFSLEELSFLLWSTQLLEPEYVRPSRPVRISELIPSFS